MLFRDRLKPLRDHQIEQILLTAHKEREAGFDLVEEYFATQSSLDHITRMAHEMLQEHSDPAVQSVIVKNLSECIVVKTQRDKRTLLGTVRKFFKFGKCREVIRAEKVIASIVKISR